MKYKEKRMARLIVALLMMVLYTGCDSLEVKMKRWGVQCDVAKLEKMLSHKRINIRVYAISLLAETCHPDAIRPLIDCLQDDNEKIRRYAAQGLGYLGACGVVDKPTIMELAKLLRNKNYISRHDIMIALGRSGLPCSIPPLIEMLHNQDDSIRKSAIAALKCLNRKSTFPCSQIGAAEVLTISNALEVVQSDGRVKSKEGNVTGSHLKTENSD